MAWVTVITLMLSGITSGRVLTIAVRGGIELDHTALRATVATLGVISTFAGIAWGLWFLAWYAVIGCFIGLSLLIGMSVTRITFPAFVIVRPFLDIVTIACAAALWLDFIAVT